MVFDVESIGLHGEGYAVGFTVVDMNGKEIDSGTYSCDPENADGWPKNRKWVAENVPDIQVTHEHPVDVREAFWNKWAEWKKKGAVLVADCAWPVEAGFLGDCVNDEPHKREWGGPYPLHDLASVFMAADINPLGKYDRKPNELPEHHPLSDARQSARLLIETLKKLPFGAKP